MTLLGIEPATSRLVAQCLNQPRHCVSSPLLLKSNVEKQGERRIRAGRPNSVCVVNRPFVPRNIQSGYGAHGISCTKVKGKGRLSGLIRH
jgi:hypothetical protein